jgi:2-octaprenyl-6-methoxyphenol hydroxylase
LPKSRAATKNLVLHEGMIGDISFDADAVRATLANGQRVTAKLAAADDGRMSPARTKAGIGTRVWSYPQIAFSFTASGKSRTAQRGVRRSAGPSQILPGFLTSCDLSKGRWFAFL